MITLIIDDNDIQALKYLCGVGIKANHYRKVCNDILVQLENQSLKN